MKILIKNAKLLDAIFDYAQMDILVEDQEIGYNHPSYGAVLVDDLVDYTGTSDYRKSSYKNGVFTFNVVYYVSAGIFGYGPETFALTGSANAKSKKVAHQVSKAAKRHAKYASLKTGKKGLIKANDLRRIY